MWLLTALLCAADAPANPYLERAIAQLNALDETAALATLAQAKAWPSNTPQQLARVHLYIGLAHAGLAHEAEALASFKEALVLEPELALPGGVPPRVKSWWLKAGGRPEAAKPEPPAPQPKDAPILAPVLEPAAPAPAPAVTVEAGPSASTVRRGFGVAASALGLAAIAAAIWVGVQTKALEGQAQGEPKIGAAQALQAQAELRASIANALYAAGGPVLAGGLLLIFIP